MIEFISLHYKQKNDELRQSLEQETWLPADIPYTYGIYFNIIFGIKMASSNKESDVNTSLRKGSDDILRSSRPFSIQDANLTSQLNGDDESVLVDDVSRIEELNKNGKLAEEFYSIKKNEIYIKEKRFKTINSFLLLLRIICEDFNIAVRFNSLGKDAVSSIFDIIKV